MTPQPVATVPKEIAPIYAVTPPPAPTIDFSQLLNSDSAATQQQPAATQNAPDVAPIHPFHGKRRIEDADAANAAAALPAPLVHMMPAKGGAATAATGTPAPATGGTQAALAVLPAGAGQSGSGADGNANPNGNPGTNGTAAPPGAAELEARVSVGAPTFLSQPNPTLVGLLHQANGPVNGPQGGPEDDAAGPAAAADAGDAATTPALLAKLAAVQSGTSAALAHDAAAARSDATEPDADGAAIVAAADTGAPAPGAAAALTPSDGTSQTDPAAPQSAAQQAAPAAQTLPAYEQVAVNLRQAAQSGTDHIEIQLKPASLGAIHVKLDVSHDGHISAVISADRSDTLNMLRQDSSGLTQALRDAGLQADSGSLSFNLRGDAQSFAQNQQTPSGTPASSSDGGSSGTSAGDSPQPRYSRHHGALDIEV